MSPLASAVGEGLSRSPQDFTADPLATIHGPTRQRLESLGLSKYVPASKEEEYERSVQEIACMTEKEMELWAEAVHMKQGTMISNLRWQGVITCDRTLLGRDEKNSD
jgi:hypothetical protein